MEAYEFGGLDKASWGPYNSGASTPRGSYKISTSLTAINPPLFQSVVYYWDYGQGEWMAMFIRTDDLSGWSKSLGTGNMQSGCTATLLEDCPMSDPT